MGTSGKGGRQGLLLAAFFGGGASFVAGPALAQAQAQQPQPTELSKVVVTGSMVKRADAETAEAITILSADALKAQGITSVEQVINTLTSATPAINISASVGTFSGGGTFANLRGLGNARTLVLLDGERLAPNAFNGAGVDLSGIPFSAIESVEVLREGASALYGSDAIAGVINFKTKKNYRGGEIDATIDVPQHPGGRSGDANLSWGHGRLSTDGYNILITGSYSKQEELTAQQRGFSAYGLNVADGITGTNFPGSWPGVLVDQSTGPSGGSIWQYGYPTCAGNPYLTTFNGACSYRSSAATDLLPESHELSGLVQFTKALPYDNELKAQYFVAQSQVNAWSGPMEYNFLMDPNSPYYPTAAQLTCVSNCTNPTTGAPMPVNLSDPMNAFWTDPNNNRYMGNTNIEQRLLVTFSGSNNGWDYSADFNWSKNLNNNTLNGGLPDEAILAPGGVLSDLINPFGPQSAAGQALINSSYMQGTYEVGQYTYWAVDGHATHALGDAFNAGTPATLALGTTLSTESFSNATTPFNTIMAPATGLTDSAVAGHRQIQAIYMELDVPMSKSVDFDISDREDRYSDFGQTNNGKIQLLYHPTDWVTFRGTASTGFRAPTLNNLYAPNSLAASSGTTMGTGNPECTPTPTGGIWTAATCGSQGIGLFGGNNKLTPETSKNFDLGLVLSPVADLGITLDYFRVMIDNTISVVPSSAIYGNPNAFPTYIHLATTGTYAGTLVPAGAEAANCTPFTATTCGYIIQQASNTGFLTTSGMDLSVQYRQRTSVGTFHEDLEGTWVTQFKEQQYTGGPTQNLLGNLQIQTLNPAFRWQHNITVDWTSPGKMWGAGLVDRYWSGYADEFVNAAGNIPHVGSYNLLDGFASITPFKGFTALVGVKNILNTSPPLTNATQNNFAEGYNALIADPRMRNFYINLKYSFL
jgi:iron complex outermembrane recepter protein